MADNSAFASKVLEGRRLFELLSHTPVALSLFRGPQHVLEAENELAARIARGSDPSHLAALDRAFKTAGTVQLTAINVRRDWDKDGHHKSKYFNASVVPVRDPVGVVEGVLWCAVDVTKEVEATKANSAALGVLAHGLRTPLQVITMSSLTMLRDDALPDRHTRTMRRIANSGERMGRMLSDLLDYVSGASGEQLALRLTELDLGELVGRVVDEARVVHPYRSLLYAPHSAVGYWDTDRIQQVVVNLTNNAIRHGQDPITVAVNSDADEVLLDVHSGGAIESATLRRIFEPFRRGELSPEGLGLGLYIAKGIVAAHGGTIAFSSSEAEGTTFSVRLPRRK